MTLRTRRITSYAIFVSPNQSRTVRGEGNRHFEGRTRGRLPNRAFVIARPAVTAKVAFICGGAVHDSGFLPFLISISKL